MNSRANAAERIARRRAADLGATIDVTPTMMGQSVSAEAPRGLVWSSDPSFHVLVSHQDTGDPAGWVDLLDRMGYGVQHCPLLIGGECEYCQDPAWDAG